MFAGFADGGDRSPDGTPQKSTVASPSPETAPPAAKRAPTRTLSKKERDAQKKTQKKAEMEQLDAMIAEMASLDDKQKQTQTQQGGD